MIYEDITSVYVVYQPDNKKRLYHRSRRVQCGWVMVSRGGRTHSVYYCAPLHGGEVVESELRTGRERQHRVFALALSCGCTYTSMTPLFSLKTQLVARQQEHAVTGMLGGGV